MKKILIVDDEPDVLELFKMRLQKSGYEVVTASSGSEALDMSKSVVPDLVLLDIALPQMDGYEICRRLKGDPQTKGVQVAFMTCKDLKSESIIERCLEFGPCGFIDKLADTQELLGTIKDLIG